MTNTFYAFECTANNCQVEFYVNDIPISLRGGHKGHFYGGPVNQYLINGQNEIAMVVSPGPTPSLAEAGKGGRKSPVGPAGNAVAVFARYPRGSILGGPDGTEIARIEWPPPEEEERDESVEEQEEEGQNDLFPLRVSRKFDLKKMYGTWEWQRASSLTLGPAMGDEIFKFLSDLRETLEAGDPEPFIKLSAVRLTEVARAYEKSPSETASVIRYGLPKDAAQSWWGMEPIDTKQFDLRLCAGDRMVECIAKDWEPILREAEDDEGGRGYYNMMLSKIGGEWFIVR